MTTKTLAALDGLGVSPDLWVSGMTVARRQLILSPADDELYRRKTVTGGGAVDPADDIINYNAVSYKRTSAISPRQTGIVAQSQPVTSYALGAVRTVPTISAGARAMVLSAGGRGALGFLGLGWVNPLGSTRVEIIIDGRSVLDTTIGIGSTANSVTTLLGVTIPTSPGGTYMPEGLAMFDPSPVEFRRTCQVFITSANAWAGTSLVATMLEAQA